MQLVISKSKARFLLKQSEREYIFVFSKDIDSKMNKNITEDIESVMESCSARNFDEEAGVTYRSAENYHEPLEASHGARIRANEVGVSQALGLFRFRKIIHLA